MRLIKLGRRQVHVKFYKGTWHVRRWRTGSATPHPATTLFLPFGDFSYEHDRTLFGYNDSPSQTEQ